MKLIMVSNYINHHQIPLSDALYSQLGKDYLFIQTEKMSEERIKLGWDNQTSELPYVACFWENPERYRQLLMESDCVIFGGAEDEEMIIPRLEKGLFTLRYSERIYKDGRWKFISPRGLMKKYHDHIRFRKSSVYLLCAGAYVAGDFDLIKAYPGKMLKFGYFPESITYDDVHFRRKVKKSDEVSILWAARFIDWKHPEMMLGLAKMLKTAGTRAHITMIGTGELINETVCSAEADGLSDMITFTGALSVPEVRNYMEKADIFVLTSDQREGWGAVINEAMNSGCAVVASHAVGAAPFLIQNKVNGRLFVENSLESLNNVVSELVNDSDERLRLGNAAYETITTLWNADVAASRLLEFIESKDKKAFRYENGPLSTAGPYTKAYYRKKNGI